jgi:hypothetical protein
VVVDFRAALLTDGIGVPAVRKTMAMLQGVFSRAVECEEATTNPFAVVRKPRAGRQRVCTIRKVVARSYQPADFLGESVR